MARLKIDLRQGFLEIEGEDTLVRDVYEDFRERFAPEKADLPIDTDSIDDTAPSKTNGRKKRPSSAARESYEINKTIDLYGKSGKRSLKDFYEQKQPSSNLERNAVFVYFLKKEVDLDKVSLNDVYTCYKALSLPAPGALRQSVADTSSSRYGWIDASDLDDIRIPLRGETFVEHDLPKSAKTKATEGAA